MRKQAIFTAAMLILIPGLAVAQPQPQPVETCGVCDFPPEVITTSIENLHQLQDRMREAEVPVREYVVDSIGTVERGSARGVRDFSAWYRYTVAQENARELQNRLIGQIVQRALDLGLNFFLPGSGAVATAVRGYGSQAYGFVLSQAPSGTTDPGPYLDRIAVQLENGQDRLRNMTADMFHDTSNTALRNQMESIRMEYVWEKQWQRSENDPGAGERTPGPDTRRLLQELGITQPGDRTYQTTREQVLTKLVYDALCARNVGNPVRNCEQEAWYYKAVAQSVAIRLIVTDAQPARMFNITAESDLDRICRVERTVGNLMMSNDCRAWSRDH
jgi:hypothetical protein